MEEFVDHFFTLNQTDYEMNMPLQNAKYVIDILSPLILFSLSTKDELLIHDTNQTKLTEPMYEYYMQFKIYPQYKQFLKQKEDFCKRVIESFYPAEGKYQYNDMDYETAKPFLQEYYGITEDPRQLKSMKQSGNSVTYTKERWIEFINRMSPGGGSPKYYRELTRLIESLSIQLPTNSIWKYLMAVKYFLE
jgi:hypothetical protein